MPCIRFSSERQDIIDVNRRSVQCKSGISIVELSMMDGVMGKDIAESIRSEIIAKNVTVRQLTNLSEIYANWTQYSKEMQAIMNIRYIAKEVFDIQNEILIFDNTVAMYHVEPEVYYMEIEDPQYADMMRALFDNLWKASQMMIWGIGGGTRAKQYIPYTTELLGVPTVVYPAKDDGEISQAYMRNNPESIQEYLEKVLPMHSARIEGCDMLILYVWNDGTIPMVDIWKVMRNTISDDSGFLYDGFTLKGDRVETGMGVASGNSLIVFTAEELLLRRLVMDEGMTFLEASNRELYFPTFPAGLIPSEQFFTN